MRLPSAASWRPDVLDGFVQTEFDLSDAERHPSEGDAPLLATLVRRAGAPQRERAVLYVHGWNDYFFQTHLADFFESQGFDFYAIDLRRYGRSLRTGHLQGWVTAFEDYSTELDAAQSIIRAEGHTSLLLHGHSTGGLITTLYAADRPGTLSGLVLNAPFLYLRNNRANRAAMSCLATFGALYSGHAVTRPNETLGVYARSIYAGADGRWDYDRNWKSTRWGVARLGWLRAVRDAQARVAMGLDIDCPVVSLSSKRWLALKQYGPEAHTADTVLDTDEISRRAALLGDCVTIIRIPDAMHDLALSDDGPLQAYFDALARWLVAYIPPHP